MARLAEEEREKQRRIGERITEVREQRRLTQPVVADRVGVSLRAYQNWEAGDTRVAWANLEKLAAVLEVSEDYLLSGEGGSATVPVPTTVNDQYVEIDARLANIEQMLSQLLQQERPTDQEASLQRAVALLAEGVREEFLPKDSPGAPRKKSAARRAS